MSSLCLVENDETFPVLQVMKRGTCVQLCDASHTTACEVYVDVLVARLFICERGKHSDQ
jgi:hypothetical protein